MQIDDKAFDAALLAYARSSQSGYPNPDDLMAAIKAYLSAAAPQANEPVAWQRLHPTAGWQTVDASDVDHYRQYGQEIRALYDSPTPQTPSVAAWVVTDDDGTMSALMVWSTRDDAQAAADALGMDDSHVVPVEIRVLKPQPETDGRM